MDGGGSEKQLLYLLQHLDRDRFEVFLYLLYPTGSLFPEIPSDVTWVSYWGERTFPKLNWPGRIHRNQVEHLKETLHTHRIEVVYDRLYHMALITGPATAGTSIARVSTIVSPPSQDLVRNEKRWMRRKKELLRQSYINANALLSVSQGTVSDAALFYGIPQESIRLVPSPIDIDRIEQLNQLSWDNSPLDRSVKHLVSVGRLSDEKGHRYLIQAIAEYERRRSGADGSWAQTPPVLLHLLGDGVLRKELESLVASLGLHDQVLFHGHQANPFSLLAQSDLFILPSLYEGLPNAVLEAMVCRVPVVATNTEGGAGELFRRTGLGGLVPVADSVALAEAIHDRFTTPEPWTNRIAPAHRFVMENHRIEGWIETLSEIFEGIKGT